MAVSSNIHSMDWLREPYSAPVLELGGKGPLFTTMENSHLKNVTPTRSVWKTVPSGLAGMG